jgi:hypothetical protein
MSQQEEFFSSSHKRLLSISVWAKYAAWVVLVAFLLGAIGIYVQEQNMFLSFRAIGGDYTYDSFMESLIQGPVYGLSVFIEMLGTALKGIVYFLVLKAISLGIDMIVETDINYREREAGAE